MHFDGKSKRVSSASPSATHLEGIRLFLQSSAPGVLISKCSFKYPRYIERSFKGRRHKVSPGDSVQFQWRDDRDLSTPLAKRPSVNSYLLVEQIVEVACGEEVIF
jgi:hypothetical protein